MTQASRQRSSPPGTRAWLSVVQAYNLCEVVMTSRLAALGVRVGEHEVLANLATSPGMTQQQLSARCFVAKSGVSMLLTQMESQALVRREVDEADARVRRLYLTPDGEQLARATMGIQSEVVTAMVSSASTAELELVTNMMLKVSATLEAMRAEPALRKKR